LTSHLGRKCRDDRQDLNQFRVGSQERQTHMKDEWVWCYDRQYDYYLLRKWYKLTPDHKENNRLLKK